MAQNYLDLAGLSHFWDKVKEYLNTNYAAKSHNHDGVYAKASHTHTGAQVTVGGTGTYGSGNVQAAIEGLDAAVKAAAANAGVTSFGGKKGAITIDGGGNVNLEMVDNKLKASVDLSSYATTASVDSKLNNKVDKTTTINGQALSQTSITITGANVALTGYAKGASADAITASDSVNAAIGKLEKGLDGKSATGHTHTMSNITDLAPALALKAPLASPTFTGTPKSVTPGTSSNDTTIATTAFVQSVVNNKIAASDAMIYKGTLGTSGTITALPEEPKVGWTYKVITAGTYASQKCEIGDMIICLTAKAGDDAATWTVVQNNIDGAVTGPASATAEHVAVFDGATGKVIKDSGFTIGTSVPSGALFTDTTYTFAGGTNGSFTVTPKGGTGQIVTIGKPATAGRAESAATADSATTASKVANALTLKFNSGTTDGTSSYTFNGSAAKTIDIMAGPNVTITPAAGSITIQSKDTVYTHPVGSAASKPVGFYKISTDANSHVASAVAVAASDLNALGAPTTAISTGEIDAIFA